METESCSCENIDPSDSLLVLFWREKKIESSGGKWTQDLSIKLWVLYLLSYWGGGVPCFSLQTTVTIQWLYIYICTNLQVVTLPVVEDFVFKV